MRRRFTAADVICCNLFDPEKSPVKLSPHRFSFCQLDGTIEPCDNPAGFKRFLGDYEYITVLAQELSLALPARPLHFVAMWASSRVSNLKRDETVLIAVGDERGQVPEGTQSARLVLRTGSPKCPTLPPMRQAPFSLWVLSGLRETRNLALRLLRCARGVPLRTPMHVESVPIGHLGHIDLEPIDMRLRKWTLSFAGTIGRHWMFRGKRIALTPKSAARLAMLEGVTKTRLAVRDLEVRVVHPDMEPSTKLSRNEYHCLLRATKISLCPRGNFAETFRLYESACLGCAILTDPLPKCWYFNDHPFIEVSDWRKLPEIVLPLLGNETEIGRLGGASREWWNRVACPRAIARRVADMRCQ